MPTFRDDFLWGVAAASFQIEGATDQGDRGDSVWDLFCRWPGKVKHGDDGSVACDHYHRYAEDADLIQDLGAGAYRLSVAWPRVMPQGVGQVNEAGLAFYDRLVDALLERGVQPWVTLYHWDLPTALHHRGGWLNADIPRWFGDYTRAVVERLSDRVSNWFTLNEPACFVGLGYDTGEQAPGLKLSRPDVLRCWHHALLAHGEAVRVIREHARTPPRVGAAPVGKAPFPATDEPADVEAARHATFAYEPTGWWPWNQAMIGDPAILGQYPEDFLAAVGHELPAGWESQMPAIREPLDFYGMNLYNDRAVVADGSQPTGARPIASVVGAASTHIGWPVSPDMMYWGPKFIHERYGLPIYITENGLASMDWVHADGGVHDTGRVDFLTRYLTRLRDAANDGVDLAGYFHWSILDNFEWAEGYSKRFGLVHVDFQTQKRTPKDSYHHYAGIIASNGGSLPDGTALPPLE